MDGTRLAQFGYLLQVVQNAVFVMVKDFRFVFVILESDLYTFVQKAGDFQSVGDRFRVEVNLGEDRWVRTERDRGP